MNSTTVRNLLVRGRLAGLAAGVLARTVPRSLGEPDIDQAIGFEEAHAPAHGHEAELVTRGLQSTAGLATGVLVHGVTFGGIAALAYRVALGRVGRFSPRAARGRPSRAGRPASGRRARTRPAPTPRHGVRWRDRSATAPRPPVR